MTTKRFVAIFPQVVLAQRLDRAGNDKVGTWAQKKPMSHNSFGHLFRITTWGESHGPAIGCVVDGCPPGIPHRQADIQTYLDKRKPGQSRYTTQRKEPDQVRILSGVFTDEASGEQVTTGTPIALEIENMDARSKDYGDIKDKFRPGHADYTYLVEIRRARLARLRPGERAGDGEPRGGRRHRPQSRAGHARARRAGADRAARDRPPQLGLGGGRAATRSSAPTPRRCRCGPTSSTRCGKKGSSAGAVIEIVAEGVPAGLGAPIYGKLDQDIASGLMSINAVKGVEIGAGFAAAALSGEENADEMRMRQRRRRPSSCPTMPAAFSAASRPGSRSSRASR